MADNGVPTVKRRLPGSQANGGRCGQGYGSPGDAGTSEWQTGPRLSLWWAPLDISASVLRALAASLSSEERHRADHFRRSLDRARFLAARGWLRHLLANQLGCAPDDVPIRTCSGGKPRLASSDLRFSAARSAAIALYATSWRMEVGVDIEAVQATIDIDGLAARFMSAAEQRALASLPRVRHLGAFFDCWARKEAYVKGIGVGLSFPLRDVDVWDGSGRPTVLSGWSVHQVNVAPGFAAAVAGASHGNWVPGAPHRLERCELGRTIPRHSPATLMASRG